MQNYNLKFKIDRILNLIKKIIPHPIFIFFQPIYHYCLAFGAALVYGFPSRKMKVIGVTGTKGKSSTVYFLGKIFEAAGYKIAALSSIQFKIVGREWPNKLKMTMPGRFQIQKFLAEAKKAGCEFAILEVTSQGVLQSRHEFINFDAAIFTNLTPEHIEAHGSFENYKQAKLKFFRYVKNNHIVNKDSGYFGDFWNVPAENKTAYSLEDVKGLKLQIVGEFNLSNAAAAIKTAEIYGIKKELAERALSEIKFIPGRMEFIEMGQNFTIIVDYAHTPDSLEKVYKTAAELKSSENSKLICVLGAAGGGRDKWKRSEMGKVAGQHCYEIILTNEDPYDESPSEIVSDIEKGISINRQNRHKSAFIYKIIDRKEAVKKAISLARKDDVVILTGKGSESSMCVGQGRKIPWDERKTVEEILRLKG